MVTMGQKCSEPQRLLSSDSVIVFSGGLRAQQRVVSRVTSETYVMAASQPCCLQQQGFLCAATAAAAAATALLSRVSCTPLLFLYSGWVGVFHTDSVCDL